MFVKQSGKKSVPKKYYTNYNQCLFLDIFVKEARYCIFHQEKKVDPLNITQPAQNIFTSNLFKACFKFQNKQLLPQHSYILSAILNHA